MISSSRRCPTARCRRRISSTRRPSIGWEMDVAWVIRGGADPLKWIDEYGQRITAVHVKDIAPAGENANEDGWADVGHGTVDWARPDQGVQGEVARQDLRDGARQSERSRTLRAALDRIGQDLLRGIDMAKKLGVGVIGCGNISTAYFRLAPLFKGIEMRACADINMDAAKARAKEFGLRAETVDDLLAAKDIDIIVNLTIPAVHYEVSRQVLDAGKHVYSEKPFVLSVKEGLDLKKRAEKGKLRIGSAPDTFLGGAHQLARHLIDNGKLGKITSGTCYRDEPRHGALASQSRTSSSSRAPARCSTSAPTTSPT